jgi:magnesium-transporting ATPase (P-type)
MYVVYYLILRSPEMILTFFRPNFQLADMSTTVVKGRGKGIVITTGIKTEAGKISEHLAKAKQPQTPLQRKLGVLGKWLVFIAGWLCGLIIAIGLIQGKPVQPLVLLAVSLGVSVIPEGLATVVVVTMALGVRRMAKKNAIVRRLAAVETLGSVSTICSDKTGTLTEGKMRATTLWLLAKNKTLEITGSGTEPVGEFLVKNSAIDPKDLFAEDSAEAWKPLRTALEIVSLCNNAAVQKDLETGNWERIGDPTEVALMLAAMKMEFGKVDLLGAVKKQEDSSEQKSKKKRKKVKGGKLNFSFVTEVAFDSNRKRMSVVYKDNATGDYHVYVKGGLESVMSLCTTSTTKQQARIEKMVRP